MEGDVKSVECAIVQLDIGVPLVKAVRNKYSLSHKHMHTHIYAHAICFREGERHAGEKA